MSLQEMARAADEAGARSKRQRRWFCAGWNERDRRANHQIRLLVESYSEDLRERQERIDLARAERDNLRRRQMVPEGYIVIAESTCTLDPKDSEVTYRIVKEDEWLKSIGEVLE